jgi:cytidine deaminase
MWKHFKKVINWCELDLKDRNKNEEFYKSMRELVTILFAVVFGVGLSQLGEVKGNYDLFVLILAYVAVLLSWWGYHLGTIVGPSETNVLAYLIDCGLLVLYWYLINVRSPLTYVLLGYVVMFLLYFLWEVVRYNKEEMPSWQKINIKNAIKTNFVFFFIFLTLFSNRYWLWIKPDMSEWYYILTLLLLLIIFRIMVNFAYRSKKQINSPTGTQKDDLEKTLVERAKDIAANARVHLSGIAVGAAILSDTGRIYVGCNVEFDNYSNTIHAEEAAISAFVAAGEKHPVRIAVFTFDDEIWFPCGMCRQSLFELGGNDLKVIACNNTTCERKTIEELLPSGFHL